MSVYRIPLSIIAVAALLFGVPAVSANDQPQRDFPAPAGERLEVPTTTGMMSFVVSNPDKPRCAAWSVRRGPKYGNYDPAAALSASRHELTSRVVVKVTDRSVLDRLTLRGGIAGVRPVLVERGYWSVETTSVREALALANELLGQPGVEEAGLDLRRPWKLRSLPDDPRFYLQWHLKNDLDPLFDVNAETAWNMGFTGAGVVIGIVEGAWQHDHVDLAANFLPEASMSGGTLTSHATSCAGVAAAVAFNDVMGCGVAYGAWLANQIYGTDEETAEALAFRNDLNDIKSNSWGPPDIGHADTLPSVIRAALEEGVRSGRGGLGEIYVWAAGNGGLSNDRVDYDPFVSSRYTIAVGAIGDQDVRATYNERGSSMMVVAHSSGNVRGIYTTAYNDGWTSSFGGTSSASPLAAGVVALVLQANPELTWRDVQHVLIHSARKNDPNNPAWVVNGGGLEVNEHYGFGAVDAGAAVALAQDWINVPHEVVVDTGVVPVDLPIPDGDSTGVDVVAHIDRNIRIETVELILNVETNFVGDLEVWMTAPSGVRSTFAKQRSSDGQNGYHDYVFTSFRHWDELSAGDWTIHIADLLRPDAATWVDYRLVFYGTPACPGDLDEDGDVDLGDIYELLGIYGLTVADDGFLPEADLDNDNVIGLGDLARLLSQYGRPCP